jgi:uncharacterized phiE125 gp8 family phage protein
MTWRIIEEGEIPSLPLGRLKAAFRIHHDHDDDLLRHLTHIAKQYIETYTQSILGDVRLELTLNQFTRSQPSASGVLRGVDSPVLWIPLPIGPLRTLESVSVRDACGTWIDLPTDRFSVSGHRLGVRHDGLPISNGIHSIRIIGRGGLTPIPALIESIWQNLVRCLYDSDTPDMSVVQAALAPLKVMKVKTLA